MSASRSNSAAAPAEERSDDQDALKQATIMMVDDEPIILETLENLLEDAGYKNFVSTTNPKEAIELMESRKPDIVLLDVMMPEVTGLDLLESMGMDDELQHTPSIIITAATDSETKLKALDLGATDVLNKPVDPSELALRVRNTLATKATQDRLMKFDALTGLPNRRYFMIHFAKALARASAASASFAKGVAKRLETWLRDADIAAISGVEIEDMALSRIGGDEFVLILNNVGRVENAVKIAGEILSSLEKPYRVGGREVFVTASAGIVMYPEEDEAGERADDTSGGEIMDALLSHADIAMSEAKRRGRKRVQPYTEELNASSRERQNFRTLLRGALEKNELTLTFRPKASVWTNQITGAEAVLGWQSPELGFVPREQFIGVAEETGLIVPVSEWMLHEACALAARWRSSSVESARITVSISSRQFDLTRLMLTIRSALNSADVPGACLGVEFTESIFVDNAEENRSALQGIKDMGVEVSVGNFGTGHSSLTYLKTFPVDQLKIDPSFLEDIQNNADNAAIVASFIPMTHSLGLTVVADGVVDGGQLDFLKDRGCDEYQGELLSQPVPASDFLSKVLGAAQ
jgi:predicted signal transduction protein with EAL and GGDEF domain